MHSCPTLIDVTLHILLKTHALQSHQIHYAVNLGRSGAQRLDFDHLVEHCLKLIRKPLVRISQITDVYPLEDQLTVTIGLPPVAVACFVLLKIYSLVKFQCLHLKSLT